MLPVIGAVDDVRGNPNRLLVDINNEPVILNEPVTVCTLDDIIPILTLLPDTISPSALNVPALTVLFEDTWSIGIPDISFTENREPDRLSVTENNCPIDPWMSRIIEPDP